LGAVRIAAVRHEETGRLTVWTFTLAVEPGGEPDEAGEVERFSVVAAGDSMKVFDAAEEAFDDVAVFVMLAIVVDRLAPGVDGLDASLGLQFLRADANRVAGVGRIGDDPFDLVGLELFEATPRLSIDTAPGPGASAHRLIGRRVPEMCAQGCRHAPHAAR
jgi:hypothetical protein